MTFNFGALRDVTQGTWGREDGLMAGKGFPYHPKNLPGLDTPWKIINMEHVLMEAWKIMFLSKLVD